MEDNEYHPEFEPSKASKIIKNVFKYAFFALIIFIYGFFILRFCTSEPDTKIIWTPEAIQAKAELGDSFKVYTQEQHIFIDEYKNVPVGDGSDRTMRYGYNISIFDVMYFPATKQLQVTVRYNKSIMEDLMDEYGADTIDGEPFLYTLLLEDGTRISTYRYTATSTNRYYFRYLIFDNVDLNTYELVDYNEENSAIVDEDGNILAHETTSDGGNILYDTDEQTGMEKVYKINYVYLDTYYMGDVNFEDTPISCLLVYERDIKFKEVNWKKTKENTSVLIPSPAFIQKD